MLLERTHDYALLRAIATHPRLWEHVSDDGTPPREEWKPAEDPALFYVLVREVELLGFFLLAPQNCVCYEIHVCLLPEAWGERADAAFTGVLRWAWAETPARRIVGHVPASNRLAVRFAARAGLTEYGRNPASYLQGGALHDQILLGISKPE
jgi:RimJ/RimL family protein N-acetyltransferase